MAEKIPTLEEVKGQVETPVSGGGGGRSAFNHFQKGLEIVQTIMKERKGSAFALPVKTVIQIFGYQGRSDPSKKRGVSSIVWALNGKDYGGRLVANSIKAGVSHNGTHIVFREYKGE